jgi:hypothetical protein
MTVDWEAVRGEFTALLASCPDVRQRPWLGISRIATRSLVGIF